ncbi:hypothetical protein SteCoe_14881 [Stentor coeruleus]|uniref:Uncharacterized protein n=1 Tax=Stentor coeruleus TaxID=5963 RepID=A0A1R2C513_9CILI|nr:hypothetical protein SteCoe_14881 [Stentor coeruleus]
MKGIDDFLKLDFPDIISPDCTHDVNMMPIDNNTELDPPFYEENRFESSNSISNLLGSTLSSDHIYTRPSGRKKNVFTLILEQFYTIKARHPKKEFFNAFIIRSIKRAFRCLAKEIIPIKTCIAVDLKNNGEKMCWLNLQKLYKKYPEHFNEIAATETSPLTDGKSKRNLDSKTSASKSFNNIFCRDFFADELMQKTFLILIELIFSDFDPSKLRTKLNFYCCTLEQHCNQCYKSWTELRDYLNSKYFLDLEVICEPITRQSLNQARSIDNFYDS